MPFCESKRPKDIEGQGQYLPFSIPAARIPRCIFGANLVILAIKSYLADKLKFLEVWVKMVKMTLKVKVNDLHFQYQMRASQNACLVQIWWFYPKSMTSYRVDKPTFLVFWVKMAKMTLRVKVNDPYFQYQPRVPHDACLVQIWWFQLKSVTSYRADKVKFTDGRTVGQTDRRTDAGNDNTPFGLKGHGVKINFHKTEKFRHIDKNLTQVSHLFTWNRI